MLLNIYIYKGKVFFYLRLDRVYLDFVLGLQFSARGILSCKVNLTGVSIPEKKHDLIYGLLPVPIVMLGLAYAFVYNVSTFEQPCIVFKQLVRELISEPSTKA